MGHLKSPVDKPFILPLLSSVAQERVQSSHHIAAVRLNPWRFIEIIAKVTTVDRCEAKPHISPAISSKDLAI
jgi:hypothetical protein